MVFGVPMEAIAFMSLAIPSSYITQPLSVDRPELNNAWVVLKHTLHTHVSYT